MIGIQINNYKVISKIGDGGMGMVFLAKHLTLERDVAIKKLNNDLTSNDDFKLRFLNEARILAKLNHPSIINIYDFIEEENDFYIIMEYVSGLTLDELLKSNTLSLSVNRALKIFDNILSGFSYAHEQGIIHRDIKPSNIIINQKDEPKILDFGIAKMMQGNYNLTKTGTKMGSLYYMSPEQILGKEIDNRTDIYSLGILLYEMLSFKLPYNIQTDTEYEIMDCILKQNISDLNIASNATLSKNIDYIIKKACSKDPEYRYKTINEFKDELSNQNISLNYNTLQGNTLYKKTAYSEPQIYSTKIGKPKRSNAATKNTLIILAGSISLIIFFVLLYLFIQDDNDDVIALNQKTSSNLPTNACSNVEINGRYSGTIKDGTRWEVYIYGFDGKLFKGTNTIYWSFIKNPNGLTSRFDGELNQSNCQLVMAEDPNGKKTGKFIGKISSDGKEITGEFFRYSDNGSYTFNLIKE